MTTLKKTAIVQLFFGVTRCSNFNSATQVGNPITSDRGQCATANKVRHGYKCNSATLEGNVRKFDLIY